MTLILAHRGASGYQPEMTQAAYELGLAQGADGVEVDVRLTKDGELIAIHDRNTKRVSNGALNISASTLNELKALNFYGESKQAGNFSILKLVDLVDLCLAANRNLVLAIETKHPSINSFILEKRLAKLLKNFNIKNGKIAGLQIILMSFNWFAVRAFKRLMPGVPRVLLVEHNYPFLGLLTASATAEYIGPGIELLNKKPRLIEVWRKRGKKIFVWTVDQPKDVEWCLKKGVEIFVSNFPDRALKLRQEVD